MKKAPYTMEHAKKSARAAQRRPTRPSVAPSPRVLIVEDDPAMAELISTLLSTQWINCVIRHSGLQAAKAFKHHPVDLIITDLRMDAGDGIELIEKIRHSSAAPVIIVTGYAREYADRVRFLDHVAMIAKPFDNEDLLELVEKALNDELPPAEDSQFPGEDDF